MNDEVEERSFRPFREQDLASLAEIGLRDHACLIHRNPHLAHLQGALICVALCQGGALHYVDGRNGVKDLDIWLFYRKIPAARDFHPLRHTRYDLDDAYFGRHPSDRGYKGRRLDVLGRSIKAKPGQDPAEALRCYLDEKATESARWLAQKAVVLLWPDDCRGEVAWPIGKDGRSPSPQGYAPNG